jgi:hypothetical protein
MRTFMQASGRMPKKRCTPSRKLTAKQVQPLTRGLSNTCLPSFFYQTTSALLYPVLNPYCTLSLV